MDIKDRISVLLLVDEITHRNSMQYLQSQLPIALFVIDTISDVN